ncbi:hypothetical protein Trydic_g11650 [Trypoxylus dichotomus]
MGVETWWIATWTAEVAMLKTDNKGRGRDNDDGYGVQQEHRAKEGVRIIVTEEINNKVVKYKALHSRIVTYGPVKGAVEEEISDFYLILQRQLDEAREGNETTIVIGD